MTTETQTSRPWTFHKKFKTFAEADKVRQGLIKKGVEVRVRRREFDNTFDVKTREPQKAAN